jgi:large repetitive protein
MKQIVFLKALSVAACMLLLCLLAPTPTPADTAQYIYDDLGRLVQVIDGQGNVATYNYDAVGNLLSITRSTGGVGAPTVTGITPNSGAAGATVNVSLAGTNLTGASVSTNKPGIVVSNVRTTATAITATFTISFATQVGATVVTVTTTSGSATTNFTVNATAPSITTLTPNTGPPTRLVTIAGTGFHATPNLNQISFNGVPATTLRATPTQLLTQVPAGATTGPVTVTANGLTSSGAPFTVTTPAGPPPTVTALSPTAGTSSGGTKVTFTGTNFVTGTTALFGTGAGLQPTILSPTQMTAIAPFTRAPGVVDVVVTNANGDAFVPAAFTYVAGPNQSINAITPTPGLIGTPRNAPVTVSFARPVDRATITTSTFSLSQGATPVAGTFGFEFGDTVVQNGYTYLSGAPQKIGAITPTMGLINIPRNTPVTVSFSQPVNRTTITTSTFAFTQGTTPVAGTFGFAFGDTVVTFTPSATLAASTAYTLALTQGIKSVPR